MVAPGQGLPGQLHQELRGPLYQPARDPAVGLHGLRPAGIEAEDRMGYRVDEDDAFSRRRQRCEERYQLHVVGEASYQDAIRRVCQGRTSSYADRVITKDACCTPEPDN